MKTLLFSPGAYNLAETTRTIEVAKACRDSFDILFVSYGGEFESLIENEGFAVQRLEPQLTPDKIAYLYKVDQGEAIGYFFSVAEIEQQVDSELVLLERVKPAAVVTGFNFSSSISCRLAKVPLIWLTHSTWMFDDLYRAGLAEYSDMLDIPPLRWLPDRVLTALSRKAFKLTDLLVRPYDQVARRRGIEPFRRMTKLWEGDYNLVAEPPEFCELKLPDSYRYIGPLIARLDVPVPAEIDELAKHRKDRPIVFFSMGSSGQPKVIANIVESFANRPCQVIAPVKAHLEKPRRTARIPANVHVTDWLPAHLVNPMADVSVVHGGIGTVMTACLAETPVVGISMQPEQEANIDCLVRKGFAIRIRKNRLTPKRLCEAIDRLLGDQQARKRAREFAAIVRQWDRPAHITEFFKQTYS